MEALPTEDLRALEWALHDAAGNEWRSVLPSKVAALTRRPEGWVAASLLSGHPNGFVREQALVELVLLGDPRGIPFIVLRMNDWVGPVRAIALRGARSMLAPGYAQEWIRCLPLVDALARSHRADHAAFVEDVVTLLGRDGFGAIRRAVNGDDVWSRRRCAQIWLASEPDAALALLENRDPLVRLAAARAMKHLGDDRLAACFEVARHDRFSAVRRHALREAVARLPDLGASLEALLFDPVRSLRELARFHLGARDPRRDFAAEYRSAVARAPTSSALNGLVETGGRADMERLVAQSAHESPVVRRRIVRAVAPKMDPRTLVALVGDEDSAVRKAAANGLAARMDETVARDLLTLVPAHPDVERRTARLLGRLGYRTALAHLLELARVAKDPRVVIEILERWLDRWVEAPLYKIDDTALLLALGRAPLPASLAARIASRLR